MVAGAPCFFAGLMAIELPGGDLQLESHDRFVHAADLFDGERSITQPLTIQQQQL